MRRFFSDDSFWNTPIGPDPEVDPRSDHFIDLLGGEHGGPFWINLKKYTIPVYEVDAQTPRHTVHQIEVDPEKFSSRRWGPRKTWFRQGKGFGKDVPIPDYAESDSASDRHMAMVDWAADTAWDMWYCRRRDDGEWESYVGMVYPLSGSGVWRTSDFDVNDGESIHFHGPSRAAGVPATAGLVMQEEVLEGRIRHKLAYATPYNALKEFVSPAAWTDGHVPGGLPEGALMQLDPSLDAADFDLSPAGAVIFRALQEYGMVNVDNAGGNTLYGEGLYAHPDRSWDGVLNEGEMEKVPLEHYRVLELGEITHMGDSPRD